MHVFLSLYTDIYVLRSQFVGGCRYLLLYADKCLLWSLTNLLGFLTKLGYYYMPPIKSGHLSQFQEFTPPRGSTVGRTAHRG